MILSFIFCCKVPIHFDWLMGGTKFPLYSFITHFLYPTVLGLIVKPTYLCLFSQLRSSNLILIWMTDTVLYFTKELKQNIKTVSWSLTSTIYFNLMSISLITITVLWYLQLCKSDYNKHLYGQWMTWSVKTPTYPPKIHYFELYRYNFNCIKIKIKMLPIHFDFTYIM